MSPLAQFDQELEKIIRELTLKILAPRLGEFDAIWEVANRVCDLKSRKLLDLYPRCDSQRNRSRPAIRGERAENIETKTSRCPSELQRARSAHKY